MQSARDYSHRGRGVVAIGIDVSAIAGIFVLSLFRLYVTQTGHRRAG